MCVESSSLQKITFSTFSGWSCSTPVRTTHPRLGLLPSCCSTWRRPDWLTTVVLEALRKQRDELLRQQQKAALVQELMAIARRCVAHIDPAARAADHGDMLYNERGLPQ